MIQRGGGRWYNVEGVVVADQEMWRIGRVWKKCYVLIDDCVDGRVFSWRRVSFGEPEGGNTSDNQAGGFLQTGAQLWTQETICIQAGGF